MDLRRKLSALRRSLRARQLARKAVQLHHPEGRRRGWRVSRLASLMRQRGARDLFLFRAPSGDRLVLKVYQRTEAADQTFATLKATETFTQSHVKARFFVPETGVVAMDYAGTTGLDTKVGGPDHTKAMEQAGAWLRRFHFDGDQGQAEYRLVAPIRDLPTLPGVAPYLRTQRHQYSKRLTREVQSFVDFKAEHLIEKAGGTEGELIAIDRQRHAVAHRELDLGHFLIWAWRDSQGKVARSVTRDAFLKGYGAPDLDLETLTHAIDCLLLNQYLLYADHPFTEPKHRAFLLEWAKDVEARRLPEGFNA